MLAKLALTLAAGLALASPAPLPLDAVGPKVAKLKSTKQDRYITAAYDPAQNGMEQLDAALVKAKAANRNLVVVLGANWCHDSAALANDIAAKPLAKLFAEKLDVVFIDVGRPKIPGKGRNLDVPRRFGIDQLVGTPTVLVLSPDGKMLNDAADAKSWRNAASRKSKDVEAYFRRYTAKS
jgi:thiol-disulfide isomerase/thioredoxin